MCLHHYTSETDTYVIICSKPNNKHWRSDSELIFGGILTRIQFNLGDNKTISVVFSVIYSKDYEHTVQLNYLPSR